MFNNLFGIHESALLLYGQRVSVLASNMANADTPGYKARDIDFAAYLSGSPTGTPLGVTTTRPGHIATLGPDQPAVDLQYRNPYQASLDGNTVEMAVEQAAFAENNVRYQASLQLINNRIAEMQFAIAGQ